MSRGAPFLAGRRGKSNSVLSKFTDNRSNMSENMAPTNQAEEREAFVATKSKVAIKALEPESSVPKKKRFSPFNESDDPERSSERKHARSGDDVLDLATSLDINDGMRLEVEWQVEIEDVPTSRWWGATLLEHDGRTDDGVAIRILEYDPFPEGGFAEPSREDVVFIGRHVLINYPSQEELQYRLLADDDSVVVWVNDEHIETLVDTILTGAMQKSASNFNALPRSQQAFLAEKIAAKKEKLVQLLKEHVAENRAAGVSRAITAQDAQTLIARTMMEG